MKTSQTCGSSAPLPRRPLAYAVCAYIFGIAFCYLLAPAQGPLIFAAAGCAAVAALFARRSQGAAFLLLLGTLFCTGAAYAHTAFERTDPLEREMTSGVGYAELISGHVLSAEQRAEDYRLLTLWADGRKLLVRIYGKSDAFEAAAASDEKSNTAAPALSEWVGLRVTLKGALSFPDTARNPRCFDYRLFLLSRNIRVLVTCSPEDLTLERKPEGAVWQALHLLARVKAAFISRAHAALPEEQAALFIGMMFGDKEELDEETYELFKRTGTAHILSVSGLHVGMVYAFAAAALGRKKTARFYTIVLLLLLCYAALSNFSPSVLRAVSMIAVHIFSKLLNRRYDMLTGILFSALIMLLFNPLALFGAGFLLSYTAVISLAFALPFADRFTGFRNRLTTRNVKDGELGVFYGAGRLTRLSGYALRTLVPMALIQLFMLPLTIFFFNCAPLTAIFANIPIIALSSLIVPFGVVCLLLAAISLAFPMLAFLLTPATEIGASASGSFIDLMLFFASLADKIPGGTLAVPSPPFPILLLLYGAAFFLLSDSFATNLSRVPAHTPALPAAIALCCILAASSPVCARNDAVYTFVDVGQGDCLHIRTRDGRNYLMDGGGKHDYDVGKNILAPYLLKNGVSKLDGIFVSHLHMDHFKGLAELVSQLEIGAVYVYEGNRLRTEAVTHAFTKMEEGAFPAEALRYLAAGDTVLLGNRTRAEALFPPRRDEAGYESELLYGEDENRTSLILRFVSEEISVLMTGDVGKDGEREAMNVSDLAADILKVGHHGSKNSTSEAFLNAVHPAAAIIQVGKNNTYGHPTSETLGALENVGLPVYRNDLDGAILIRPLAGGGFSVQTVKRDLLSPMLLKDFERTEGS